LKKARRITRIKELLRTILCQPAYRTHFAHCPLGEGIAVGASKAMEDLEGTTTPQLGLVWLGFLLGMVGSACSATGLVLIRSSTIPDDQQVDQSERRGKLMRFVLGIFLANGCTSILDSVSLSLAPLSMLAPLGMLTVVLSLAVAHTGFLGVREPLTMRQVAPCSLIVFGVTICTLVVTKNEVDLRMNQIYEAFRDPGVIIYLSLSTFAIFWWFAFLKTKRGRKGDGTVMTVCSGIAAGLSAANTKVMMKVVSTWARALASGLPSPLSGAAASLAITALPMFAVMQLFLVNKSLTFGRVVLSVPVYMTSSIISSMISGAVIFGDMRNATDVWRAGTLCVSLIGVIVGIFTLVLQTPDHDSDSMQNDQKNTTSTGTGASPVREIGQDEIPDDAELEIPRTLTSTKQTKTPSSDWGRQRQDRRDRERVERQKLVGAQELFDSDDGFEADSSGNGYGWFDSWENLYAQGVGEQILLAHYAFEIVLYIFGLALALVLRRIAYYRHLPMSAYVQRSGGIQPSDDEISENVDHFRLVDVGYQLIPDRSESQSFAIAGDLLAACSMFFGIFPLGLAILFRRRPPTRPVFMVSIIMRWYRFMLTVELMRPIFYLWTSMPAPDIHCVMHNETRLKPTSLMDALQVTGAMSQGCGDLVFSGHVSTALVGFFICIHYAEKVFGRHLRPILRAWYLLVGFVIMINCYIILAVRHHYTVDLVAAGLVTWLLWTKVYVWQGANDTHPVQIVAAKRGCSLWCCARKPLIGAAGVDARTWQMELARMAKLTPWKAHLGLMVMVGACVLGGMELTTVVVNAIHTAAGSA
jgi:hypothetical protein